MSLLIWVTSSIHWNKPESGSVSSDSSVLSMTFSWAYYYQSGSRPYPDPVADPWQISPFVVVFLLPHCCCEDVLLSLVSFMLPFSHCHYFLSAEDKINHFHFFLQKNTPFFTWKRGNLGLLAKIWSVFWRKNLSWEIKVEDTSWCRKKSNELFQEMDSTENRSGCAYPPHSPCQQIEHLSDILEL